MKTVDSGESIQELSKDANTILGKWKISYEDDMRQWAEEFAQKLSSNQTILLKGAMGSGKTTLVIYLMKALSGDEASSPTFSLVNEYLYPEGIIYHFDLYRIKQPEELVEIGFEEYLDREATSIIEWPDVGEGYYYEDNTTTLSIEIMPDDSRLIKWKKGIDL